MSVPVEGGLVLRSALLHDAVGRARGRGLHAHRRLAVAGAVEAPLTEHEDVLLRAHYELSVLVYFTWKQIISFMLISQYKN